MAKQKIIAIYYPSASGGMGDENRESLRVGRDRVEFEDKGGSISVKLHARNGAAHVKTRHFEVAKAMLRYWEWESPEDAATREAAEAAPPKAKTP